MVYTAFVTYAVLTTSVQIYLTLKVHKGNNYFLVFTVIEKT